MNTLCGLPAAASVVAWRNDLGRATARLDQTGPATRALCAAAFPLPSVLSGPLLGEALAVAPSESPPALREDEPMPTAPRPPRKRSRQAVEVTEPPCSVDESRLRALAAEPEPVVRRPALVDQPKPVKLFQPERSEQKLPRRRRSQPTNECEPPRVAPAGVAEQLREAVSCRIGAEPDELLDVLRRVPRVGRQAPAELLDRLREGEVRRLRQAPGDTSGASAAVPGGERAAPVGRSGRRPAVERGKGTSVRERAGAGQPGNQTQTPPGGSGLGLPANDGPRQSGGDRLGQLDGGNSVQSGNRLAQSGGEGQSQFAGDSSALPGDGEWPDGRAGGRSTESVEGASGTVTATYEHGSDAESRVGGPNALSWDWADDEPAVGGWDDLDVERVLERVLGDAARRHGIEV